MRGGWQGLLGGLLLLLATSCEQQQPSSLCLLLGGDLLLDRGIARSLDSVGMEQLLEGIRPLLREADVSLVNLECPVTELEQPRDKRYVFRGDPAHLPDLRELGITHVSLANNHTLDQGLTGFLSTLAHLRRAGIGAAGLDSAGCQPLLLAKGDVRVALYASNRIEVDSTLLNRSPHPCMASAEQLAGKISQRRQRHPDETILALLHWGAEYHSSPAASQRHAGRLLIDAGADLVVGHHPHVVQGWEEYGGGLIVYSLGNFLFDQTAPDTREGWLLQLEISQPRSISWQLHPVDHDPFFGLHLRSQEHPSHPTP